MKKLLMMFFTLALFIFGAQPTQAYTFASTNDINRTNGWAHVDEIGVDVGEVTLDFIQPRAFQSCFEYRTDGDTSQFVAKEHPLEFYGVVPQGDLQLYPSFCLSTISNQTESIEADEYVEIRLMYGAEGDERFDWTRFNVLPAPFVRSATITSPTAGQEVSGIVSFDATLTDKDEDDSVQWAVRPGTCASGADAVWSNVDGRKDPYNWDNVNFHTSADTSAWTPGGYCFVFNPSETTGDTPIRETREFIVIDPDTDDDGILNEDDFCPNTDADPTWEVSRGTNRWQVMDEPDFGWYQNKPGKKGNKDAIYVQDMTYTYGCNCNQILDKLTEELGENAMSGHYKFGCSSSVVEDFHEDMNDGELDGRYLLETVNVDTSKMTNLSSISYNTGLSLHLESKGIYSYGPAMADTEWQTRSGNWISGDLVLGEWHHGLDVVINNVGFDWSGGPYAGPAVSNAYTLNYVTTADGFLNFKVLDDNYGDNSGTLTVRVFADL